MVTPCAVPCKLHCIQRLALLAGLYCLIEGSCTSPTVWGSVRTGGLHALDKTAVAGMGAGVYCQPKNGCSPGESWAMMVQGWEYKLKLQLPTLELRFAFVEDFVLNGEGLAALMQLPRPCKVSP